MVDDSWISLRSIARAVGASRPTSMVARITLGMLAGMLVCMVPLPERASAQSFCFECGVQYWPEDDCYINSCTMTGYDGAQSQCSQQGGCDSESCSPYGGICNPHATEQQVRSLFQGSIMGLSTVAYLSGTQCIRTGSFADALRERLARSAELRSGDRTTGDVAFAGWADDPPLVD